MAAWAKNGSVWVSQRLLSALPRAEWNWAEHDDRQIGWQDLTPFFRRLQYQECIGESDGFCLLAAEHESGTALEGDPVADSNAGIRVNEVDCGF
jgi:hypothetical protein